MDEQRLTESLRAAAADAPEPGFDHADVLAGSRRIATRNRRLLTGGIAAAAIVLAGGVTAGIALTGDGGAQTSAAAPMAVPSPPEAASGPAGSALARESAPLGPAAGDCVNPQDPELRALVDAALPALASATEAPTTMLCRPGGGREVNLDVVDGALSGLFTVVYTPPDVASDQSATAVGWVTAEVGTASGGTVTVTSRGSADSGGVPFAGDVAGLAAALGPRL